jgi:hypothetical protein
MRLIFYIETSGWPEYAASDLKKITQQESTPLCGGGKSPSPFTESADNGKEEQPVVVSQDDSSANTDSVTSQKLTSYHEGEVTVEKQ